MRPEQLRRRWLGVCTLLTLRMALPLPLAFMATGCLVSGFPPPPSSIPPGVFTVSPGNPRLLTHSALQFTVLLNGKPLGGPILGGSGAIQWSSSNPAVATVDGQGNASLLSPGAATITASSAALQGLQASTTLTVTTATNPVFSAQPSDTNVSAMINAGAVGGVRVQLLDNLGGPLAGQQITISIGTNPPATGTLTGTLTHKTDASGTATFADLKIDWLGQGYTLVAAASPISGAVNSTSNAFNELRVGDPCLGPNPSCSSGCANISGDGLNDAWKIAGGIDMNGDGLITDSVHDVLLPGADPNKPDVYVKYDYMVAPTHSHQPSQAALDQVVAAFAAHNINLHFIAPNAGITETVAVTLNSAPTQACAGPSVSTMRQLRAANFGNLQPAYHYMVFAHNATCTDTSHCSMCPIDPESGGTPDPTATGVADLGFAPDVLGGDDVIIAMANVAGIENQASAIMHELGHNFGLQHGGSDSVNHKPNYMSVMNYSYQSLGIPVADAPGSTNPLFGSTEADCGPPTITSGVCATPNACHLSSANYCYRVDYSGVTLASLDENSLNENAGVSGPASNQDIVLYFVPGTPTVELLGASNGSPIDWNNDGAIRNPVKVDLNNDTMFTLLSTRNDWETSGGLFTHLNFRFQCTKLYGSP
jgi:hypothetical protein